MIHKGKQLFLKYKGTKRRPKGQCFLLQSVVHHVLFPFTNMCLMFMSTTSGNHKGPFRLFSGPGSLCLPIAAYCLPLVTWSVTQCHATSEFKIIWTQRVTLETIQTCLDTKKEKVKKIQNGVSYCNVRAVLHFLKEEVLDLYLQISLL